MNKAGVSATPVRVTAESAELVKITGARTPSGTPLPPRYWLLVGTRDYVTCGGASLPGNYCGADSFHTGCEWSQVV